MVAIYSFTAVLSAFLVFLIQPVVAKIALPTLGGTPIVWSGCMLFFQAVLLGGYIYAHVLTRKVGQGLQFAIHLLLLTLAVAFFPVHFDGAEGIDPVYSPLSWLLVTLFYSVGLPFFVISASSPLLQRWFSRTGHKDAANPYFLYAAGNVGSMGALLLYPIAVEPFLPLLGQVQTWEIGVTALLVGFAAVVLSSYRAIGVATAVAHPDAALQEGATQVHADSAPSWALRGRWLLLSLVPASLLYGVTTYVTTDIAPVPLLWIVPLALYLLTFIFAFSTRMPGVKTASICHVPAVILLLLLLAASAHWITVGFLVHIIGVYFITLSLHGALAKSKPTPEYLTEFFLWVSFGGVLGGIFNTLIAPFIFSGIFEYPLMLVVSLMVWKEWRATAPLLRQHWKTIVATAVFVSFTVLVVQGLFAWGRDASWSEDTLEYVRLGGAFILLALIYLSYRYLREALIVFSLCVAIIAVGVGQIKMGVGAKLLFQGRSLYGVYKVQESVPLLHTFMHGTTMHGMQYFAPGKELQTRSYYTQLADIIAAAGTDNAERPMTAIGLGAGTIACHAKPGQEFDFYEIDPLVEQIASNPAFFTYLRDCPPELRVILGDGRMKIAEQEDGRYGVIFADAFSSDSIPIHLLTKEAVEIYMDKLAPGGVLALHISNRHVNLKPVLSAIAAELGLPVRYRHFIPEKGKDETYANAALWVVMTKSDAAIASLEAAGQWHPLPPADKRFLWRDDFSNIVFSLNLLEKWIAPQEEASQAEVRAEEASQAE